MERTWTDELDRTWHVVLDIPDLSPDLDVGGADAELIFSRDGSIGRSIEVIGPLEEFFETLPDVQLQHALDAAGAEAGIALVDGEGHLWWARASDQTEVGASHPGGGSGAGVIFSDGEQDLIHGGPLSAPPEELGEDELLELLDEARGRIMDPMDVTEE